MVGLDRKGDTFVFEGRVLPRVWLGDMNFEVLLMFGCEVGFFLFLGLGLYMCGALLLFLVL